MHIAKLITNLSYPLLIWYILSVYTVSMDFYLYLTHFPSECETMVAISKCLAAKLQNSLLFQFSIFRDD